jgi:hypothetical protein
MNPNGTAVFETRPSERVQATLFDEMKHAPSAIAWDTDFHAPAAGRAAFPCASVSVHCM